MNSLKHIECCEALLDLGTGLCCRLYNVKISFSKKESRPSVLVSSEYERLRQRVEKSFPEFSDISKVQGYEHLKTNAHHIINELNFFNGILTDVAEFKKAASVELVDLSKDLVHCKLEYHRNVILIFFDLLVLYIRVLTLTASVEERKLLIGLRNIACTSVGISDATFVENHSLITLLDNIQRHFIDEFTISTDLIGGLLLQFYESLKVYDNCETLRKNNVLNPTNDGDQISHPARNKLYQRSNCELFMYTELASASNYIQYCIFSFLACPLLLFHPERIYEELFKFVMSDNLVVEIYRELTLNVHIEFESIFNAYPSKRDTVVIPKGFKVKTLLKEVAKVAVINTGNNHQEKRSYIHAEVTNLNNILRSVPGLLGPKFPVIVAAASMAKAEVLHYFRHLGQEARKDVRKYFNVDTFRSKNISVLINDLNLLISFVEQNCGIVQNYYGEYLQKCDKAHVVPLVQTVLALLSHESKYNIAKGVVSALATDIEDLASENIADLKLNALRINWNRLSLYFASYASLIREPSIIDLTKRMNEASERSHYVDNLQEILKKYFCLHEVFWFQSYLVDAYQDSLLTTHSLQNPLSLFTLVKYIEFNDHPDCPEQIPRLCQASSQYCDALCHRLVKFVESCVKSLWEFYYALETKTKSAESIKRYENDIRSKQTKGNKAQTSDQEQLPGYESEGWAIKHIGKVVIVKRNLMTILADAKAAGTIEVCDREYNLSAAILHHLTLYFDSRVQEILLDGNELQRPSITLTNMNIGWRVLQIVDEILQADNGKLFRSVLFQNFVDLSLPALGNIVSAKPPSSNSKLLIWKLGDWFMKVINQICQQDSGLLWIPFNNEFSRLKSSSLALEMYLNRQDLKNLCTLIGPQGVAALESIFLSFLLDKVGLVRDFLQNNRTALVELHRTRYKVNIASNLAGTNVFIEACIQIGVVLAIRQSLHQALKDSIHTFGPIINSSLEVVSKSIEIWEDIASLEQLLVLSSGTSALDTLEDIDPCFVHSLRNKFFAPTTTGEENKGLFELLPAALGSIFMASYWGSSRECQYLLAIETFTGNQHCIILTAYQLLLSVSLICHSQTPKANILNKVQVSLQDYLEISSNILLHMRTKESDYADRPVRPMALLLELFVDLGANHISRSDLEQFFPYSLIHSSRMDISMGRIKYSDNITTGINNIVSAQL